MSVTHPTARAMAEEITAEMIASNRGGIWVADAIESALLAYGQSVRNETLEECAVIANGRTNNYTIEKLIRSLKQESKK
jgi:hypothetical protein